METKEIIESLLARGYSKYRIAKLCKVSWATVRLWEREVFDPKPEHRAMLEQIERGREK